jgi:hypothetical protein
MPLPYYTELWILLSLQISKIQTQVYVTTINISVAAGFTQLLMEYRWNNKLTVATAGDYAVTVTNSNGCLATKRFYITVRESRP